MLNNQEHIPIEMPEAAKNILIVEDDEDIGEFLTLAISQMTDKVVFVSTTSATALEVVRHINPDLLLLDYRLDEMNGVELYDQIHAIEGFETVPAIVMSASLAHFQKEIEQRHLSGLEKPFGLDELSQAIEQALSFSPQQG
jgi:CheY-like chemotaxis protein